MKLIYKLLKLNRLIKSYRLKLFVVFVARKLKIRHLSLRIDPVTACNLRCKMCPLTEHASAQVRRFTDDDCYRLGTMLFEKALQVVIGCSYEPTMHNQFMNWVKTAKKFQVPYIGVTSNGQLLNERHLEEFIEHGLSEIAISIHGIREKTYQKFMVKASYARLLQILHDIDKIKKKNRSLLPSLRINYTVNSENIDEIPHFFEIFNQYGVDTLQIRPMHGQFYPSGRLSSGDNRKYQGYLATIARQCSIRKITLIAPSGDIAYKKKNYAAIIYPEVFYHINPNIVWKSDFYWRNETYENYCKRINYDNYLIRSVFMRKAKLLERAEMFAGSGRYDII